MAFNVGGVLSLDERQLSKILKAMSDMPEKLAGSALRSASNKAATPMLKAAKQNVPVRDGTLQASMAKKVKTYQRGAVAVAVIGAKRGFHRDVTETFALTRRRDGKTETFSVTRKHDPALYSHLVENGATIKTGGMRGQMHNRKRVRINGKGFLMRSYNQGKAQAEQIYIKALKDKVSKTWRTVT
jgi:HK97 gp10 family phage protein